MTTKKAIRNGALRAAIDEAERELTLSGNQREILREIIIEKFQPVFAKLDDEILDLENKLK